MSTPNGTPRRVVLSVPGLCGPPPAGDGCGCATSSEDALLEELDSCPGLLALDVDPELGVAVVLVPLGRDGDLRDALARLARRGVRAKIKTDEAGPP